MQILLYILMAGLTAVGIYLFVKSRASKRRAYDYYIVENNFAARIRRESSAPVAERLLADGTWEPYADVWDVCTNGRYVDSERKALEEAAAILDLRGVAHQILKD